MKPNADSKQCHAAAFARGSVPALAPSSARALRLFTVLMLALGCSACAVVSVAGAAAGAAISVTGAVVSTGVSVTGKVIEKTIDVVKPASK